MKEVGKWFAYLFDNTVVFCLFGRIIVFARLLLRRLSYSYASTFGSRINGSETTFIGHHGSPPLCASNTPCSYPILRPRSKLSNRWSRIIAEQPVVTPHPHQWRRATTTQLDRLKCNRTYVFCSCSRSQRWRMIFRTQTVAIPHQSVDAEKTNS
jgi:hypothetical protein